MGWFAIACIFGLLLFWTWEVQSRKGKHAVAKVAAVTAVSLIAFFLIWAWFVDGAHTPARIIDRLGHGIVARFLFGLMLGFGIAYAMDFSPFAQPKGGKKPKGNVGSESVGLGKLGTSVLLSLGIGVAILALAAPHLDNWLRRVTTLKSSLIELQLGGIATHKISVAEGIAALTDAHSLAVLRNYNISMQLDIEFFERFDPQKVKNGKELLHVFNGLISPIAICVQTALDNGLSYDSARLKLRPLVDNVTTILLVDEQIVQSADPPGKVASVQDSRREKFWADLQLIPELFSEYLGTKREECLAIPSKYAEKTKSIDRKIAFPDVRDYKNVSPLYVAALHFMTFETDGDTALRILQKVEKRPDFLKDYSFLWLAAKLSYVQGRPGDIGISYFGYLEEMRRVARQRQDKIAELKQICSITKCAEELRLWIERLSIRERRAELLAMNSSAYYVAEDLARDLKSAASYQAKAKQYAEEIHKAIKNKEVTGDKYNFLDTYAYATMVLEARKSNPDVNKFKKMAEILEEVVESYEIAYKDTPVDKFDLTELKIVRAHLASARELAGE